MCDKNHRVCKHSVARSITRGALATKRENVVGLCANESEARAQCLPAIETGTAPGKAGQCAS